MGSGSLRRSTGRSRRTRRCLLAAAFLSASAFILISEWSLLINSLWPPKVAFLFITKGDFPLDFLWDRFFEAAPSDKPYSVYIHAPPGVHYNSSVTRFPRFQGRSISNPIKVEWGEASMVEAERRLLAAALKDSRNQRFILLSDSCIFLHDYGFVYDYVTMSTRSFLDSFHDSEYNTKHRYNKSMAPTILQEHWRKGSQWFVLIRKHAEVVAADRAIFAAFQEHCKRVVVPEQDWGKPAPGTNKGDPNPPDCIPDEHFISTLLAVNNREHEVERRSLTYSRWRPFDPAKDRGGWHPITYDLADSTVDLIRSIQSIRKIEYTTEYRTEWCTSDGEPRPCYLFARKFTRGAGVKVLKRMSSLVGLHIDGPILGII